MAKPPGKCIFCGGSGLSKEHVWPLWARDLLPRRIGGTHVKGEVTSVRGNPHKTAERKLKNFEGNVTTIQLRRVCGRCNNGWMSKLETQAKPILSPLILGQPSILSADSQRVIATWIVMKFMITEFYNPEVIATPQRNREFLMSNQQPPEGWQIWIAHKRGPDWHTGYFRHAVTLGLGPEGVIAGWYLCEEHPSLNSWIWRIALPSRRHNCAGA
jgi:hypothetical protein